MKPEQHGSHFADDILNAFFLNETHPVLVYILLKYFLKWTFDKNSVNNGLGN